MHNSQGKFKKEKLKQHRDYSINFPYYLTTYNNIQSGLFWVYKYINMHKISRKQLVYMYQTSCNFFPLYLSVHWTNIYWPLYFRHCLRNEG